MFLKAKAADSNSIEGKKIHPHQIKIKKRVLESTINYVIIAVGIKTIQLLIGMSSDELL